MSERHLMRFRGHAAPADRPDSALAVELRLEEDRVSVYSGDEMLGSWAMADIVVERVAGTRFILSMAGERIEFAARDPLAFSYEGVRAIEKTRDATQKKILNRLRRRSSARAPSLGHVIAAHADRQTPPTEPITEEPEKTSPLAIDLRADQEAAGDPYESDLIPIAAVQPSDAADPYGTDPAPVSIEDGPEVAPPPPPVEPDTDENLRTRVKRKGSVLERVRSARNNTADHEHNYASDNVPGGLVRKVCRECGYVSIELPEG